MASPAAVLSVLVEANTSAAEAQLAEANAQLDAPTRNMSEPRTTTSGQDSSAATRTPNTQKVGAAQNGGVATPLPNHHPGSATSGSVAKVEAEAHGAVATQNQTGDGASASAQTQTATAPYAYLALAAETLEDIERVRIAAENRARALTHPLQNIHELPDSPHVRLANDIAAKLGEVEHGAELAVKRMVRETPLGGWVKQTSGIGEKQAGRLLGVIGNPRLRVDPETGEVHERTIGQLRSYCGYGDAKEQRRRKGQQGNWNAKARMRTYLIAESCMKTPTSPYRKVYEDGRAKYEDAKHTEPCAQCGKKGKPAVPGSDLRDGHKHARALRLVAKAVLKDMWLVADQSSTG